MLSGIGKGLAVFAFAAAGRSALYAPESDHLMEDYHRAWQLVGQQRGEEAIPLLEAIIAHDKTFHRAYKTLAEASEQRTSFDVEQYLHGLIEQDAGNALPFYSLGEIYFRRGQYVVAAEHYANCARRAPKVPYCYSQLVESQAHHRIDAATPAEIGKRIPGDARDPYRILALAWALRLQLKIQQAIQAATAGLKIAESRSDLELQAAFEHVLAQLYGNTSDQREKALQHSQNAMRLFERLDDWAMQLEFTTRVGEGLLTVNQPEEALAYLTKALSRAQELGHQWWIARSEEMLAGYHARLGHHDEALRFYQESRANYEKVHEVNLAINTRLYSCDTHQARGDLTAAEACFEDLRREAREIGSLWHEAFALRRLGDVYRDSGEYFKALQVLTQAVRIFREIGRYENAGAAQRVIASVYSALGSFDDAVAAYRQSLREAEAVHDAQQQERIQQGLGQLYLRMEKPRTALIHLEAALALSKRTHYADVRCTTLLFMGNVYHMLGDEQRAAANLREGLRIAKDIDAQPFEAQALIGLGELDLKRNRPSDAEAAFLKALTLAEKAGLVDATLAARRGMAETCVKRKDYAHAVSHLQAAIERVESIRARIPGPDLKTDFIRKNWSLYEDCIYVLSLLHEGYPDEGFDRQAFYVAEQGRARSFLDLLSESKARVTKGLTPVQLRRQAALSATLTRATANLNRHISTENKQAVTSAEQELAQWANELRSTNPEYQELQYPRPDDVAKVQSAIAGTKITVLEYALGERRSQVWLITEREVKMANLPGRWEIEVDVKAFREGAARPPKSAASSETAESVERRLYDRLIAPVGQWLAGTQQLLIVPDGILYYLPFEALIRNGEGQTPRYLIEDFPIAYAPSASVFDQLTRDRRKRERLRPQELLAYGDPDFGAAAGPAGAIHLGDWVRGAYTASGLKLSPLPGTRAEVEGIAQGYPRDKRKIYLGASATEASVKKERLADYRRVHFATHAVIDEQTPAKSGVVLSLVNKGDEDGVLQASEIFNLELDADLVVLSACQTGLGKLVNGEGMVGLTRAFLYAGSSRVVVSLWQVNDVGAVELMKTFYRMMNAGHPPSLALREAKLSMIHSSAPAFRSPYFWAPFVLVGAF